jgi:hypothetical protein
VSDRASVAAVVVEHDTVGARRACPSSQQSNPYINSHRRNSKLTTSVNTTPGDGELLPRSRDSEVKAFVVVVAVRVVVAADLLVGSVVFAALGDGGGDLGGGVALREAIRYAQSSGMKALWEYLRCCRK